MKKFAVIVFLIGLFSVSIFAEEHPLSTIKGPNINLQTYDHAFAGSIKDFLVWGFLDESSFTSELIMRKDGQTFKTIFKRWPDKRIYGEIAHTPTGSSNEVVTLVEFEKINFDQKEIILKIKETIITVKLTYDSITGGHMLNPVFTTSYKGEVITFSMIGEACMGLAASNAMMIIGAYVH